MRKTYENLNPCKQKLRFQTALNTDFSTFILFSYIFVISPFIGHLLQARNRDVSMHALGLSARTNAIYSNQNSGLDHILWRSDVMRSDSSDVPQWFFFGAQLTARSVNVINQLAS